jgi:hypothetical protein
MDGSPEHEAEELTLAPAAIAGTSEIRNSSGDSGRSDKYVFC